MKHADQEIPKYMKRSDKNKPFTVWWKISRYEKAEGILSFWGQWHCKAKYSTRERAEQAMKQLQAQNRGWEYRISERKARAL